MTQDLSSDASCGEYFTWPCPGFDSLSYSECSVVPSVTS